MKDKVKLLKKHKNTFSYIEDGGDYTDGYWVENTITTDIEGVLLPFSKYDLQKFERGSISFKDRKLYTKNILKNNSKLLDNNGNYWTVFERLTYDYIADIEIYILKAVDKDV